ncbi:MAG: MerR family transcriptional regulator [Coprobacillaceae bacterium]
MEKEFYTIGEVSKLCNIPTRTLHYYDDIGLLVPIKKDEQTGYRYYHASQLVEINIINQYKIQGYSLKEIKENIHIRNSDISKEILIKKRKELHDNIESLISLQKRIDFYLKEFSYEDTSPNVHLKKVDTMYVAYIREKGNADTNAFGRRFASLQALIKREKLTAIDAIMAMYYDDYRQYDIRNADIEVCVPVDVEYENDYIRKIDTYEVVSALHYGDYKTEPKTYALMMQWIEDNNYEIVGAPTERYLIDVIYTNKKEEYITELQIPIKKRT